jgi:hypothetical protein
LVSIKYTVRLGLLIVGTLKVEILTDIRHAAEHLGKALALGVQQHFLKQSAVLGFRTPAMSCGPLLERIDDAWVQIAYD